MSNRHILASAMLCLMAGQAAAAEFQPIGSRSVSMGGAGVASAQGPYAAYYNPALLTRRRHTVELGLGVGLGVRERNLVNAADTLADIDIDETLTAIEELVDSGDPGALVGTDPLGDARSIVSELTTLSEANGLQAFPTVSFGVHAHDFGLGIFGVSEATAYAVIDPNRLDVIVWDEGADLYYAVDLDTGSYRDATQAEYEAGSIQYAVDNALSYLQLTGVAYAEIPLAYGHAFETGIGVISAGASVKVMPGYTFDLRVDIDTASEDLEDLLEDAEEQDTAWGVDLGLLYSPAEASPFALGLVAKNINTPTFDMASGDSIEVEPQIRAGAAYQFVDDMFEIALDVDLTANKTFIPGIDSQFVGGGISFHPCTWFSLRGGAMQNLADSGDGTIYTAGLGLGLKWFQLDVAAQVSSETGEFDGNEIPSYARGQVALISKWN